MIWLTLLAIAYSPRHPAHHTTVLSRSHTIHTTYANLHRISAYARAFPIRKPQGFTATAGWIANCA